METEKSILKPVSAKIALKVDKKFSPQEFFQDKKGLYVWNDFKERILKKAGPVDSGEFSVSSVDLLKRASDEKIEASLPPKHIFDESDVCAVIAEFISQQSKGEEGVLLSNGYANLFYTKSLVVHVGWGVFYGGWSVGAWPRDGGGSWGDCNRVFSPAIENSVTPSPALGSFVPCPNCGSKLGIVKI